MGNNSYFRIVFLNSAISFSLNCSCTWHFPCHDIISTFVLVATYLAKYSSGKNKTLFTPRDSTTLTALAEVQHTSVSALTSAEVLT